MPRSNDNPAVKHRHILGPVLGSIAMVGAAAAGVTISFALPIGGAVWLGTALMLKPGDRFAGLRGDEGKGHIADALEQAAARIARIRAMKKRLPDRFLAQKLAAICTAAESMVDDLTKDPSNFGQVRKALQIYLDHTERLVGHVIEIVEVRNLDNATRTDLDKRLSQLEAVFVDYRRRMADTDELNLQVQLDLIGGDMLAEGIPLPQVPPKLPDDDKVY